MVSTLLALALMVGVGLVYSPVLNAGFVSDSDRQYVPDSAWMWSPSWDWNHVGQFFEQRWVHRPSETGGYYQPLVTLSLRFDGWLSRMTSDRMDSNSTLAYYSRAFQFHLTNLVLHVFSTLLVFLIVLRLTSSNLWSILLAGLFAFHPAQVESVAWITQRMTLLGGCFSLLAIVCYLRSRGGKAGWVWLTATTLFYAAVILCRPQFIALPVVFLVFDVWPFRRTGWQPILEKTPMFVLMAFGAILHGLARGNAALPKIGGGIGLVAHHLVSLALRLVWPAGLGPYQPAEATVAGVAFGPLFDGVVLILLVAGVLAAFKFSKPLFTALAGAGLLIVPALLESPYLKMLPGDQYLYLGLIIPIVAAAAWIGRRSSFSKLRHGQWSAVAVGCAVASSAVHTYGQTMNWQSAVTLSRLTIAQHPDWPQGRISLVEAYIEEAEYDSALAAAQRAAKSSPDDPSIQFYLGTVFLLSDSSQALSAVEPLTRALASNPQWIECLQNLGVALARCGRNEEAIRYLERARDLQPRSPDIRLGLGNAYLDVQRFASARGEFQEALRGENSAMAHLGLAIAWAANNEVEYARRHLEAAVTKDSRFSERAGRSPELLRLRNEPGFEQLISPQTGEAGSAAPATDSPPAVRAHGT